MRSNQSPEPTPDRLFRSGVLLAISISLTVSAYAANPFLDAPDDEPVSGNFRGTEWNDEFPEHEVPLAARIITTRIAKMPWGAIFKIEFSDLKSRAPEKHEIPPLYYIVTDDRIVLLNEEDNDAAVKKISAMDKPPEFEPGNVYGITTGKFSHDQEGGLWHKTIEVKGDLCINLDGHPSGHFTTIVWKKGVGLIEYASGYGAGREGFRLKRTTARKR
jgi:hypothetical protein